MSWSRTALPGARARLTGFACCWTLASCGYATVPASTAGVGGTLHIVERREAPAIGPVVVLLEPTAGVAPEDRAPRLFTVRSRTDRFDPPFSAMTAGDYVVFANDGGISHRLFSADLDGELQIPVGPTSSSELLRLDREGELRFFCSLHPDEHFSILVTDAVHFDVPDAAGRYYLGPVPEGTYRLSIWTRTLRGPVRTVLIGSGITLEETIWLDPDLIVR